MKLVCTLCAAVIAFTGVAWGMGDREVIREYDYPRRERVIEREKVIYKEYKHKDWEKCKDPSHHHPSVPKHHDEPKHHPEHHSAPQHHDAHHSSGGQSSEGHHHK